MLVILYIEFDIDKFPPGLVSHKKSLYYRPYRLH